QLATDVYLSESLGQWPTILIRTPYSKEVDPTIELAFAFLVSRGYAIAVQDTRGRFASPGIDSLFLDDGWGPRQDGYDTVEWIAAQSWSNGKVGTWGASALGITQYLMAGSAPPHLVCQFVEVGATNLYTQAAYPGGVLLKNLVEEWIAGQGSTYLLPFVFAHSRYDEYWERLDLETRFSAVKVPIYHLGGWHDIFTEGTINGFVGVQYGGGQGARGKQKLLIGPWTHGAWQTRQQGELTFPPNSTFNDFVETLRWFDYWLLGQDTGIMSEPPVKYYVMGAIEDGAPGNEWRTASDWPPPSQPTPFYLHANGELSPERPVTTRAALSYQYDPKNPVPTIGGRNLLIDAGPYDQRRVENRPDVLVFTTPVLEQPLEVIGKIKVKLWMASSARDTDFMAKLTDVYPDGRSILVSDGAVRARHRDSLRREDFLTPDSIYACEIDLWSTAMIFNKGHRLRVAISSSNAPRFDPNANTGGPIRGDSSTVIATNTLYVDSARPSHLLLPVISGTMRVLASNDGETSPREFALGQSFPNPMLSETQIAYVVSKITSVRIKIFNLLGQEINTLVDGLVPPGAHTVRWDGRDRNGQRVVKGIYFYRLEVASPLARFRQDRMETKKLMVLN
ncbi:MAG: CocE/NonD family hydrolase, partial [candidate division KSB1 bacterium]|nr:CocE/NonD family hydrolase [candidate division KSB1 bacterium]